MGLVPRDISDQRKSFAEISSWADKEGKWGRCRGRSGYVASWKSPQSKKAKIKWQGELQGLWKTLEDASINASYFLFYAWGQQCVIVQDNAASSWGNHVFDKQTSWRDCIAHTHIHKYRGSYAVNVFVWISRPDIVFSLSSLSSPLFHLSLLLLPFLSFIYLSLSLLRIILYSDIIRRLSKSGN